MDEFCEISAKKYKRMCRTAIILPIVAILLTVFFWVWTIRLVRWENCIPDEGIWYCDELGIEANFNWIEETMTLSSGEELSIKKNYGRNQIVLRRIVDYKLIEEDGESVVYKPQYEVVCRYTAIELQDDLWIVQDKDGNEYEFLRKRVATGG